MTITDELDLHTFRPAEVPDLLDDYLGECLRLGIGRVRIIHGKGSGTLAKRVQAILNRHHLVLSWRPAPAEAGGWGATLVELKPGGGKKGPDGAASPTS
jgi:dsDNA-specific endonuclease/ATPase MutS2